MILAISMSTIIGCSTAPSGNDATQTVIIIETNFIYMTNVITQTNLLTNTYLSTNYSSMTNIWSLTNFYTNIFSITNLLVTTNYNWTTNFSTNYTELTNWTLQTNVLSVTNLTQLSNISYLTNFQTNFSQLTNYYTLTNLVIITNFYTMTNAEPVDFGDTNQVTLVGAVLTNGKTSSALYLNGSAYAVMSNQPAVNFSGDTLTISLWVYWDTDPFNWAKSNNDYANIISKNGDGQWQVGHGRNNRKFQFTLQTTAGNFVVSGTTQPAIATWYHVAAVYDGSNILLYVNGTLEGTLPASGFIQVSDTDVEIGRRSIPGDRYFHGIVDRLGIYSTAWSSDTVLFEYQQNL